MNAKFCLKTSFRLRRLDGFAGYYMLITLLCETFEWLESLSVRVEMDR